MGWRRYAPQSLCGRAFKGLTSTLAVKTAAGCRFEQEQAEASAADPWGGSGSSLEPDTFTAQASALYNDQAAWQQCQATGAHRCPRQNQSADSVPPEELAHALQLEACTDDFRLDCADVEIMLASQFVTMQVWTCYSGASPKTRAYSSSRCGFFLAPAP